MAATTTTKKQPASTDPKFEWAEKAGTYVLRLSLAGFRKDDFRVQVDGAGRLTVRGARPAAAGLGSFHKVFQLPSAASLDDIAGRFEAGVLTLTMPKRASATAGAGDAAPTSIEELKRKPSVAKVEDGATDGVEKGDASEAKEEVPKEEALRKDTEEATEKAQEKKLLEEDVNKSRKQEQQKQAPAPMKQEETVKPKAPQGEAAGQTPMKPAPNPEVATGGDKAKAAVVPETESLAERVRQQRGEEERAKATTAASATEAKAELEKKVTAWCSGNWKERMHGELKVLTDMKWADSLVEAARNNKEVVAVGIAAFSLGLLVSHKLFRK